MAKAAPDGYTLLINSNAHSVNPAIYAKLPYDTAKDFTDIAPLSMLPNVLVVSAESPLQDADDLVGLGKANPGKINFGHAGVGSGTHLNTVKLIAAAGINVTQVPFKGTPEVVAAILSGNRRLLLGADLGRHGAHQGRQAARARGQHARSAARCCPTCRRPARRACRGADFALWFGVWGPAGMPADIVSKINADVRKALADPGVKEKLANTGNVPWTCRRRNSREFVRSEIDDYQRIVQARGNQAAIRGFLQRNAGQALQLLERQSFHRFHDVEAIGLHVDHREIGVDPVDAARAGERVGAALDDLAFALLGEVLHHHQHLLRAHREVHRAADRGNRVGAAGMPVGEVARDRDLERAEDGEIEMPAADHARTNRHGGNTRRR